MSATVIDRFLDAVAAGVGIPPELYADDAVIDATVPGWRFTKRGPAAIVEQFGRWFADAARFEEIERHPIDGGRGEIVTYLLAWEKDGSPIAARHGHLILVDHDGRIASDTVFCGGQWNAALLAEMAAAEAAAV